MFWLKQNFISGLIFQFFHFYMKKNCSDRILTFGIRSIRSPAKMGLVIIKLLTTSPVVSWRRWEEPPPPRITTRLSFFAQPPLSKDLSLRVFLPFVCIFVYVLGDGLVSLRLFELEYFPSLFFFN